MASEQIGPYEILDELGRGGMGVVFRARHTELGREVALKTVAIDGEDGPELAARFRREAAAAARLAGQPGLVGVHDFGEADLDGTPVLWFAMDLIRGEAFDEHLAQGDSSPESLARCFTEVAEALQIAHEAGVIHRDLKPSNILLDTQGRAWITDFGLAKLVQAGPELQRLTASGMLMGTPVYMAPEQAMGEAADARSDIYALGASLYEACSGAPPFDAPSHIEVISRLLREEPVPLRFHRPDLPRPFGAIIMRCLEREPGRRYQTAQALAEDLHRFLRGEAVVARPPSPLRRLRRHRYLLATGAVVVVAGAAAWAVSQQAERDRRIGEGKSAVAGGHADRAASAQRIIAVHQVMERDALPALQLLEDVRFGARVAPRAIGEAKQRLAAVRAAAEQQYPGALTPEAWELLGRYYAGEGAATIAALQQLADEAGPNPVPRLLLTRAYLSAWIVELKLPAASIGPRNVSAAKFEERPAQRDARRLVAKSLKAVLRSPLWPLLPQLEEYRKHAAAAAALAEGKSEAAAEALSPVVDHPALGDEARALLAHALYLQGRYDAAGVELERVAARGWPGAWGNAVQCWNSRGASIEQADADEALNAFDRAIAAATRWCELEPDNGTALMNRALARYLRALRGQHRGEDSVPRLEAAVEDLDRAEQHGAPPGRVLWTRALARLILARRAADRGGDAVAIYERCLADLERWAQLAPDTERSRPYLELAASCHHGLADRYAAQGHDPTPEAERAVAAWSDWLGLSPADADARRERARILSQWMAWRARWPGSPTVAELAPRLRADVERLTTLRPKWPEAWLVAARFALNEAARLNDAGQYKVAIAALDRAIALDDAASRPWAERGAAQMNWAYSVQSAPERADLLTAAVRDLDASVERSAADPEAREWRALAKEGLAGLYRRADPHRSRQWYTEALEDLAAAVQLDPGRAATWRRLGGSRVNHAYRLPAGPERVALLLAAGEALGRACELAPNDATAWLFRGNACGNLCLEIPLTDDRFGPYARTALQCYARAVELQPALAARVQKTVRRLKGDLAKAGK